MTAAADTPFARYLRAKRSVDDRALHRGVYATLLAALPPGNAPLDVLEVGCGVGTMVERLQAWGLAEGRTLRYHAIDSEPENIAAAEGVRAPGFDLRCEAVSLEQFSARPAAQTAYDLLIANAVLDLLDLEDALPRLCALLRPGGLGWFTINFDGLTILEPPVEPTLDAAVVGAYHASMDERRLHGGAGDSRTGRRLFTALLAAGFRLLAAGASDWVVHPVDGRYPADEAAFLHFMLGFFESAVGGRPEIPQAALAAWLAQRRRQIDEGRLVLVAHQYDFLVQRPTATALPT